MFLESINDNNAYDSPQIYACTHKPQSPHPHTRLQINQNTSIKRQNSSLELNIPLSSSLQTDIERDGCDGHPAGKLKVMSPEWWTPKAPVDLIMQNRGFPLCWNSPTAPSSLSWPTQYI